MSAIEAVVLAILQGIAHFFPISSSGHVMMGERFFGIPEPNLLFNVTIHVGTLIAVMVFYRKDVIGAVTGVREAVARGLEERSLEAASRTEGARLVWLLFLASVPTALIGLGIYPFLSTGGGEDVELLTVILALLFVNGFILLSAKFVDDSRLKKRDSTWSLWHISPWVALAIGAAQGFALLPGFSSTGLTIVAALWLGVGRAESARFSFLLSIPAVGGAMLLESIMSFDTAELASIGGMGDVGLYTFCALLAGVIGYASMWILVKMLQHAKFWHFSWYCWLFGAGGLALIWL